MVTCTYENLVQMIQRLIADIQVDEAWYLDRYPEIARAITEGKTSSAQADFIKSGYFEGRLPFAIEVDESYYLSQNKGVAEYVRDGRLKSGHQHFEEHGYAEGRLPFKV
jgi:hypothetical protein